MYFYIQLSDTVYRKSQVIHSTGMNTEQSIYCIYTHTHTTQRHSQSQTLEVKTGPWTDPSIENHLFTPVLIKGI